MSPCRTSDLPDFLEHPKQAINYYQKRGIEIPIAHYPPYTSKYNPLEHPLFPHLSRACKGVIFDSVNTVSELMAKATTNKGLQVFTTILARTYQTGKKVTEGFKETMEIVFDDFLPQWNYTAKPQLHSQLQVI